MWQIFGHRKGDDRRLSGSRYGRPIAANVKQFSKNTSGATAIEYAIIASLIFGAIVVSATALGQAVNGNFEEVATEYENINS